MRQPIVALAAAALCATPAQAIVVHPDGPVFVVNQLKDSHQTFYEVVAQGPNDAIVVWQGPDKPGDKVGGIWARRVERGGPVGTEQLLDPSFTSYAASYPQIALGSAGGAMVGWTADAGVNGSDGGVWARLIDDDAVPVGEEEIFVPHSEEKPQTIADVIAGADGTYLVVWHESDGLRGPWRIITRLFDGSGVALNDEVIVAEGSFYLDHRAQPAAALTDGGFVIAWSAFTDVNVTYLGPDGEIVKEDVLYSAGASPASVVSCSQGRHFVAWHAPVVPGPGTMLLGQWLAADGEPLGPVRVIRESTTPWTTYEEVTITSTPGCTAILSGGFFETPEGSLGQADWISSQKLAAATENEIISVFGIQGVLTDVGAQWLCLMRDEDAQCGDATCTGDSDLTGSDRINIRDAMHILRAATGLTLCTDCRCDTDSSGATTVTDAARVLRVTVGQEVALTCSACGGD